MCAAVSMFARVAAPVRKPTAASAPTMAVRASAMPARVATSTASFGSVKALRMAAPIKQSSMLTLVRALEQEGEAAPAEEAPPAVEEAAPAAAAPVETQVYIGNISWDTMEEDLVDTFSEFGEVVKCNVVMDQDGRSRGFAFVTYTNGDSAEAAITALNETMVDGRTIRVDRVLPQGERPVRAERPAGGGGGRPNLSSPYRLYVGNLPWRFDDYDLEDAFAEFGEVADAKVVFDRESGRSRGFGFVTLNTDAEVDAAVDALDGADVDGRMIRVNRAKQN